MGRFSVDIDLVNFRDMVKAEEGTLPPDQVRRARIQGVVDTAATNLVLPAQVVAQLDIPSSEQVAVRYADRRTATRPLIDGVWV
jgi:hypothetical protein